MRVNLEIGKKALKLRTFGTQISELIRRREVHIVSVIPRGLTKFLGSREREILLKESKEACAITKEAFELGKELFEKNWTDFGAKGDQCKTCYMGLFNSDFLEYYEGRVRLINADGDLKAECNEQNYINHIGEKICPWEYAKFAFFKKLGWLEGIIQVAIFEVGYSQEGTAEACNLIVSTVEDGSEKPYSGGYQGLLNRFHGFQRNPFCFPQLAW